MNGSFSSFDYASVRRGYQVYKEVCATCHSLEGIAFRNLINVTHTEEQMKALAADIEVEDGPNDEGEMFDRPAKLSDKLPKPYANDEAGRAANNGALPPDLTLMTKARHGGADYVFALLTGYVEPPAGKVMLPGLHYNPYFAGGAIAMEKQLNDGQLEYEDGTPATASQLAKDVSVFLAWAAEPEHDERKLAGTKFVIAMMAMVCITGFYKRYRWQVLKTRKINYTHQLN
jgi:ubiquinol-cytochrome c reductase cytochrome c1 subunit